MTTPSNDASPRFAEVAAVRAAVPADVDAITAIERSSFSDPWSAASFRSLIADDRVYFLVASDEASRIIGYVVAWFLFDEAEIANLAVDVAVRGRGIGAHLLDTVVREGSRRGTSAMYLEVRDSNVAARALYRSRGFSEIARRRRYYRRPVEDAVVMRRLLPVDAPGTEDAQRK